MFLQYDLIGEIKSSYIILSMAPLTGQQCYCSTICHTKKEGEFVAATVANKVYSLARESRLSIPGFPQFSSCTDDLQKLQSMDAPQYEVCVALPDGSLVVKETLIQYWTATNPDFEAPMTDIMKRHDAQWNKKGLKRGLDDSEGDGSSTGPANKKLKVESKKLDHEDQIQDRNWIRKHILNNFNILQHTSTYFNIC